MRILIEEYQYEYEDVYDVLKDLVCFKTWREK